MGSKDFGSSWQTQAIPGRVRGDGGRGFDSRRLHHLLRLPVSAGLCQKLPNVLCAIGFPLGVLCPLLPALA